MKATLILSERQELDERSFVEMRVWQVPGTLPGSAHVYEYRLAYVVDEVCVLRYDDERGKGNHRHEGGVETPYAFTTLDARADDFWADAARLRGRHGRENAEHQRGYAGRRQGASESGVSRHGGRYGPIYLSFAGFPAAHADRQSLGL
jgi:hypothetical protein